MSKLNQHSINISQIFFGFVFILVAAAIETVLTGRRSGTIVLWFSDAGAKVPSPRTMRTTVPTMPEDAFVQMAPSSAHCPEFPVQPRVLLPIVSQLLLATSWVTTAPILMLPLLLNNHCLTLLSLHL